MPPAPNLQKPPPDARDARNGVTRVLCGLDVAQWAPTSSPPVTMFLTFLAKSSCSPKHTHTPPHLVGGGGFRTRPLGVKNPRNIRYWVKNIGYHRAPTSLQSTQTTPIRTFPASGGIFRVAGGWVNYFATTFFTTRNYFATTCKLLGNYPIYPKPVFS